MKESYIHVQTWCTHVYMYVLMGKFVLFYKYNDDADDDDDENE